MARNHVPASEPERLLRKRVCGFESYGPSHSSFPRRRESRGAGMGNVARSQTPRGEGLVPRWGRAWAWQNPPCEFAPKDLNSVFSYLCVPVRDGMSDWYESMSRTPIRDDLFWHRERPHTTTPALVTPAPTIVILALTSSFPPLTSSFPPLTSSFPRRRESRRGGDGKRSAVADSARRGACPPLPTIAQPTLVPSHHRQDLPNTAAKLILRRAGPCRHNRLARG